MIRSMTGFGEASRKSGGVHFFLEVRSLNSKYFKATIRLPDDYQGLEADLESRLRQRISRGTVTVRGACTDTSATAAHEVNKEALEHYVSQLEGCASIASGRLVMDLSCLLTLPGVLQPAANEDNKIRLARETYLSLLDEACDHLISMRNREGMLLTEDLTDQQKLISTRLAQIEERAPNVVNGYERRLRGRIDALLAEAGVRMEPADLVREIGIYAEKTDIAEEICRLRGHIEQFSELIGAEADRPVGRTLDFLSQEMLREANTIASKSPDAEIGKWIVEIKGAIDRIKEQVQNVE